MKLDISAIKVHGVQSNNSATKHSFGTGSTGSTPTNEENNSSIVGHKMTAIVVKLVRLHHRFAALSEILAVELKTNIEASVGERRKMGTTALVPLDRLNSTGTVNAHMQEEAKRDTAALIA